MSKPNPQHHSSAAAMRDDCNDEDERKEQPTPAASTSSPSLVLLTEDAQASLARRSQRREDDERDPPEQERRRLDSLATKAAAREARLAATLAAQSAQWHSFGPAQRLFTDGVALCLGFLSLADFNSAAQTCKGWRVGAQAVKSLGQAQWMASASQLPVLLSSSFRHLVRSFIDSDIAAAFVYPAWMRIGRRFSCEPLQLDGLHTLSNLTQLVLGLDLALFAGAAPLHYPPLLTTASLALGCCTSMAGPTFDAANIVGGLVSCLALDSLELILSKDAITLTALGALKQLRHLSINGYVGVHYNSATLHAIKSLPLLGTLVLKHADDDDEAVDPFQPQWLAPLLTEPHQLQTLKSLDTDRFCLWDNEVCLQLLPSLIGLTQLYSHRVSMLALPVLAAFTQLRTLSLDFDGALDLDEHEGDADLVAAYDDHDCARPSFLVPHLAHCRLTEMSLASIACDADNLAALCNSQPLLAGLRLHNAALTTLQPLAALSQLSQLSVDLAKHSDPLPQLFDQVCACKSLQQLHLWLITPPFSEAQHQQLTPPSTALPLLTMFQYEPR